MISIMCGFTPPFRRYSSLCAEVTFCLLSGQSTWWCVGLPLSPSALSQDYVCWRERCNFAWDSNSCLLGKEKEKVLNVSSQTSAAPRTAAAFTSSLPGEEQKWEVDWSWQCMCACVSVCVYSIQPSLRSSLLSMADCQCFLCSWAIPLCVCGADTALLHDKRAGLEGAS